MNWTSCLSTYERLVRDRYPMPSLPLNGTFMIGPTNTKCFDLISDVYTLMTLKTRYFPQIGLEKADEASIDLNNCPVTKRLWRLRSLLTDLLQRYDLNWCGIYLLKADVCSVEWALVRECSVGNTMRCIIPVTPEWVKENNCAWTAHYERMCYCPNLSLLVLL